MNGCPKEEMLSALLDGELTAPEEKAVEVHVAACPTCATTIECLREVQALSAELTEEPVTRKEWDQTWAGIVERINRPQPIGLLRRLLVPLASAAVLTLGLGLWAILPRRSSSPRAVVTVVISTGLKRSFDPSSAASPIGLPAMRCSRANSTIRIAVLEARPISSTMPIWV